MLLCYKRISAILNNKVRGVLITFGTANEICQFYPMSLQERPSAGSMIVRLLNDEFEWLCEAVRLHDYVECVLCLCFALFVGSNIYIRCTQQRSDQTGIFGSIKQRET